MAKNNNIYNDIPKFLLDKRYLMSSVFFILTFSFLFMAIYSPFSITAWFSLGSLREAGMTISFYLVALAILLISKLILYGVQSKMELTVSKYILWIVAEVVIISLFYSLFTLLFVEPESSLAGFIILKSIGCVLLIVAIPYTILTLFAAYKTKTEELEMLQYELSISGEPQKATYPSLINLYDSNGTLKLTINSDSLYYMESQDNYVKIFYENQDKLLSYMLRCRTKALEEDLIDTSIVRCHRSFMVNVTKINHIKKGGKARYIILNNNAIKPIPVSKSYFKNLIGKIDKYNSSLHSTGVASTSVANVSGVPVIEEREGDEVRRD